MCFALKMGLPSQIVSMFYKRDTDIQNRLLDSVGEGKGGMFKENSIETSILSRVKQSPAQVGCMRQVLRAGALG